MVKDLCQLYTTPYFTLLSILRTNKDDELDECSRDLASMHIAYILTQSSNHARLVPVKLREIVRY